MQRRRLVTKVTESPPTWTLNTDTKTKSRQESDKNHFLLHNVIIDEGKRFDAYREMSVGATSIHPATIKDSAGDTRAVAKGPLYHQGVY